MANPARSSGVSPDAQTHIGLWGLTLHRFARVTLEPAVVAHDLRDLLPSPVGTNPGSVGSVLNRHRPLFQINTIFVLHKYDCFSAPKSPLLGRVGAVGDDCAGRSPPSSSAFVSSTNQGGEEISGQ